MLIYWELQESSDNLEEYNGQTVNKSVAQFVEDNSDFTLYDVPEDYPDLETEFEGTEADLPITIVVEGQPIQSKIPAGANPIRRPRPTK